MQTEEIRNGEPIADKLSTFNFQLSTLADIIATVWIVWIGIVYYGGYWSTEIGSWTRASIAIYAAVLLIAAIAAAARYLKRPSPVAAAADRPMDSPPSTGVIGN
jgi:hypothetical protein